MMECRLPYPPWLTTASHWTVSCGTSAPHKAAALLFVPIISPSIHRVCPNVPASVVRVQHDVVDRLYSNPPTTEWREQSFIPAIQL